MVHIHSARNIICFKIISVIMAILSNIFLTQPSGSQQFEGRTDLDKTKIFYKNPFLIFNSCLIRRNFLSIMLILDWCQVNIHSVDRLSMLRQYFLFRSSGLCCFCRLHHELPILFASNCEKCKQMQGQSHRSNHTQNSWSGSLHKFWSIWI